MTDYYTTYRASDSCDEETRNTVASLNDCPLSEPLDSTVATCVELGVGTDLYDAAGFRRGWVRADGSYAVT